MKGTQDKVKDIVDVRPYKSIRDFVADPVETLSNYHFTDATSDLMAKWLDGISSVQSGSGAAFALAGYRGVGKSHFLATLGALAANPELRTRISEPHVSFSAQRLQRRHYPVAYLRRGTSETLAEEFTAAISAAIELEASQYQGAFEEVLTEVSRKTGETPFILMIDTAFERGSRVTRDDGSDLSEIAEAAKKLNMFVGVALDDDIAGADGSNSAIVRSFSIDYLDQAHLYKVVNSHIFPKHNQMQPVLHDIYSYFREVLPSFRWSEQKFASLYPLHPAILEVAPYVRLYVHDFALLGFASEAGEKILGRPSNSLIALDEVYDSAENGLRKIEDLNEAFAAYDELNTTVVGKIPVMQRLQAKLILKALLLLSLDGQGGTAKEICASVMIFDESDPEKAIQTVEGLLKTFVDALPGDFSVDDDAGVGKRYSFKVSSKDYLNTALAEALKDVSADAIPGIIRRVFQERFFDSSSTFGAGEPSKDWMDTQLVWRGAIRRGRVYWRSPTERPEPEEAASNVYTHDWEVFIDFQSESGVTLSDDGDVSRIVWKPAQLRPDEIDKMRSFYAVSTDTQLREKFSDQIRASVHAHSTAVENILNRSFLDDGKLIIDGFDYNFTEDARSAPTLPALFASMLEPLFETRFPDHPYFSHTLDHADVASIVTDLYNGTRQDLADVQNRAQTFAFPLGLVKREGSLLVPESGDVLVTLPIVAEILELVGNEGEKTVSLADVYSKLRKGPNGLVIEAQQMVLTALVAQRLIEFVTSSGNRINRRSLDLKIIWDDIVGIAKPFESSFSGERLQRWGALFVKDEKFQSLDRQQDRDALQAAFAKWSGDWKESKLLERFAQLPDDVLNVRIWHLAARAAKTFGSVAESIEAAGEGTMPLDECIDRIADAFSESEPELRACENDLAILTSFVKGAELRDEIRSYLAVCEITQDPNVEDLRERVIGFVEVSYAEPSDALNRELGHVWEKFKREFAEYFDTYHSALKTSGLKARVEEILRSDQWWEFEMLSDVSIFDAVFLAKANEYRHRVSELDCRIDAGSLLERQPYCLCSFSVSEKGDPRRIPDLLTDAIAEGLRSYRQTLMQNSGELIKLLQPMSEEDADRELAECAAEMATTLKSGNDLPAMTDLQLQVLRSVYGKRGADARYLGPVTVSVGDTSSTAHTEKNEPITHQAQDYSDEAVVLNI